MSDALEQRTVAKQLNQIESRIPIAVSRIIRLPETDRAPFIAALRLY
jgi:hypothetical protein